jgi:hypothetical protein
MILNKNPVDFQLAIVFPVPMPGWLADFFRFWWGLLYWNARKTVFRWRGGACPCQSPSDSGHALETACDACISWQRPERFQRVCPLLEATADGLRCSAETNEVRPFWGRAIGYYGGAFGAVYLVGAIGAFALLRGIGYPVHFKSVAWPRAWPEIRVARSDYFYAQVGPSLAANQTKQAVLALTYAYELNPRNYEAGLLLAKLWQVGLPGWSDQVFARVLHDDTAQPGLVAGEWYAALLARGDFLRIAQLVPVFLSRDPADAPVWIHALFFATRRLGDTKPLHNLLDENRALAPALRPLVQIELLIETGRAKEARAALRDLAVDTTYAAYFQVSGLTALGFPNDALAALDRDARLLPTHYRTALRLDAFAAAGWSSLVRNEVKISLNAPLNAPEVELLCAHFIRYPDPDLLADLFNKLQPEPLPPATETFKAILGLFCAAGVEADWPHLSAARRMFRQVSGSNFTKLDLLESFFRGRSTQRLENVLPILQPMSIDVTYALFEHFYGNPHSAAAP